LGSHRFFCSSLPAMLMWPQQSDVWPASVRAVEVWHLETEDDEVRKLPGRHGDRGESVPRGKNLEIAPLEDRLLDLLVEAGALCENDPVSLSRHAGFLSR